jgi:class 3 adenylate cyclase
MDEEEELFSAPRSIQIRNEIPDSGSIPLANPNHWLRIPDVICVFVDMKDSTKLSAFHHDKTTAGLYRLFTGAAVRLFNEFDAPYIDVKGDGAFALFNSDQPHVALAAAVTFKTFVQEVFIPNSKRVTDIPLGSHLGIDQRTVLVKKLGIKRLDGRTDRQNDVWAGKPVNMAAKLASRSTSTELLVSDRYFENLTNDKATISCGCPKGPRVPLWSEVNLQNETMFDFDKAYRLTSVWCAKHGSDFCNDLVAADD